MKFLVQVQYWESRLGRKEHPLQYIDPVEEPILNFMQVHIGVPLAYSSAFTIEEGTDKYQLAKAFKALLVAFYKDYDAATLEYMTKGLLARYELEAVLKPKQLLQNAKAWFKFLEKFGNIHQIHRKVPLQYFYQQRRFETIVDFMIETEQQLILIQNSGLSGPKNRWKDKAMELASWFYLCKEAVSVHYPQKRISCYVHLVLQGAVIEVNF